MDRMIRHFCTSLTRRMASTHGRLPNPRHVSNGEQNLGTELAAIIREQGLREILF